MTPLEWIITWLCFAASLAGCTVLLFSGRDLSPQNSEQLRIVERLGFGAIALAVLLMVWEVVG